MVFSAFVKVRNFGLGRYADQSDEMYGYFYWYFAINSVFFRYFENILQYRYSWESRWQPCDNLFGKIEGGGAEDNIGRMPREVIQKKDKVCFRQVFKMSEILWSYLLITGICCNPT